MAFLVSPGVQVKEIDLTNVVPAVSSSIGAIAMPAVWGPAYEVVSLGSEQQLVKTFGQPDSNSYMGFLNAAQFLSYGNALRVVRILGEGANNASLNLTSSVSNSLVKNDTHFASQTFIPDHWVVAKHPGLLGNSVGISVCAADHTFADWKIFSGDSVYEADLSTLFSGGPGTSSFAGAVGGVNDEVHVVVYDTTGAISGLKGTILETYAYLSQASDAKASDGTSNYWLNVINADSDWVRLGNAPAQLDDSGEAAASNTFTTTVTSSVVDLVSALLTGAVDANVAYTSSRAATDSIHATAMVDGELYTINVVGTTDFTTHGASANTVGLDFIYDDTTAAAGDGTVYSTYTWTRFGLASGDYMLGYDLFGDAETIDVSLLIQSAPSTVSVAYTASAETEVLTNDSTILANDLIATAEARKDCVAFVSPTVSMKTATDVLAWASPLTKSSYAFADSGALYIYDKYNDTYRWVSASGSTAGLAANADLVADPWFSPAGFSRGGIRNVTKLAWNPNQVDRDDLYKKGVNPIVSFPGQGTILWGDKTLQIKASAFDRINVRRLFIVLEKAIATASKASLFEFNDEFTQAQFRNMVEPFLRDIKGRRGITDFKVVCDSTNNTGDVIDTNRFVADIYIKPARSVNFITLNFIATRTGVEFSEIAGGN